MLVNPGPPFRRNIGVLSVAALLLVLILPPLAAEAQILTTTTLTVNTSPAMGSQVVTLTSAVGCSLLVNPFRALERLQQASSLGRLHPQREEPSELQRKLPHPSEPSAIRSKLCLLG